MRIPAAKAKTISCAGWRLRSQARSALRTPVALREEDDDRNDLEATQPHEGDHDALREVAERVERPHRSSEPEPGPDVADRRRRGGDRLERGHVHARARRLDHQSERADRPDPDVEQHEADDGSEGALVDYRSVQPDGRDNLGMDRLVELAPEDLADEQVADDLDRAGC